MLSSINLTCLVACLPLLLVLLSTPGVVAKSSKTSKAKKVRKSGDAVKQDKNWQEGWRWDLDDCEKKKKKIFTDKKGNPITRQIGEMPALLAKVILDEEDKKDREAREKRRKEKEKQKPSRKQRMKQELLRELGGAFDAGLSQYDGDVQAAGEDRWRMYLNQGETMVAQMMKRAKLPPTQKLTLREFCDLVWRAGTPSPLDPDGAPAQEYFNMEGYESEADDAKKKAKTQDL